MDPALVGECVRADDCLVRLHGHPRAAADHLARAKELRRVDSGQELVERLARAKSHDDLFERSVPRALAYSVHGHLDLTGPCAQPGQRVRGRQSEVVVAVDRQDDLVRSEDPGADPGDERRNLVGCRVSHGVQGR